MECHHCTAWTLRLANTLRATSRELRATGLLEARGSKPEAQHREGRPLIAVLVLNFFFTTKTP